MARRIRLVAAFVATALSVSLSAASMPTSYHWQAEFVAADSASKTITVKTLIPDYVSKYTGRFKPGDPVTLVWDMLPPSAPPAPTPAPGSAAAQSPASGPARLFPRPLN